VVDAAGDVLLFLGRDPDRPDEGTWWFPPGGGVEADETDEQAALRELREETGLLVGDVGPPIATRQATFAFEGQLLDSDEVYFLIRVDRFELEAVHKGGAVFDRERLEWLNGQWIRRLAPVTKATFPARSTDLTSSLVRGAPPGPPPGRSPERYGGAERSLPGPPRIERNPRGCCSASRRRG